MPVIGLDTAATFAHAAASESIAALKISQEREHDAAAGREARKENES